MLENLPAEILYLIACHLPTVNALVQLSRTSRRLHETIAVDNWRIFRAFVQKQFPGSKIPDFWREAAHSLTSRSRALDKHAVLGRFVFPPQATRIGSEKAIRGDRPTLGYRPALDTYETWNGSAWNDRREVLAWGAADEIFLRVKHTGSKPHEQWIIFSDLEHISSVDDICGLHLLKPNHPAYEEGKEHLIFARARGELHHLAITIDEPSHNYQQVFETYGLGIERTDLSNGEEPILAAHWNNGTIALYNTMSKSSRVSEFARLQIDPAKRARNRYSKFLSSDLLAIGTGRIDDAITISSITSERVSLDRQISLNLVDYDRLDSSTAIKSDVNAIAPLSTTGQVFLAGWGDRAVRLHDLRSNKEHELTYRDPTDDNPIYCIQPFTHNRFVVGSGGEALVKIFDLRMDRGYSYLDAKPTMRSFTPRSRRTTPTTSTKSLDNQLRHLTLNSPNGITNHHPRKEMSIYLSHPAPTTYHQARSQHHRPYRGAIYTMSSPSPSSPTIYTGVADGVMRLDFVATDDLTTGADCAWFAGPLCLNLSSSSTTQPSRHHRRRHHAADRILDLSGYERPDPANSTAVVRLRTQQPFDAVTDEDVEDELATGWDRRWTQLRDFSSWRRAV
ncbi:hypothetical protein ASPACDRAFT_23212 [Aspergillus aculeatus ATCC 16872]|uniref:F-box domain-containing protein n=1 Tax=Aspergillus aculeatus (strain ATCC 16872 / CBS 172.66 / WB 5094) TaxID=690307 RepID=A0A1L9X2M0_ASPA1|nr:uncharacterized protein ASPACDRAFT_23212 [Aspergillus aculeatus ATCC 16872]OJK02725.1 hypothetical protein ASPACDRAFT_23212 [Aspergillus aculeatus ATCC 16872]